MNNKDNILFKINVIKNNCEKLRNNIKIIKIMNYINILILKCYS